ncbi:unnamed protein product [Moneuplotes crassus]|uniref:Uncharacterized protein n=2 Tax=Euplotes crassus TaxID=5936 RepID=A0AAD1XW59_EUPCR|nr:unnamed protein product [Moneuplotes crassus]
MANTILLSLLCPAFATKSKSNNPDLEDMCKKHIGVEIGDNVEFFKLVKIDPNNKMEFTSEMTEVAIRLKNSEFSLQSIEGMMTQKEKLQEQITNLASYCNNIESTSNISNTSLKEKYTSLESENKRLKRVVKAQMEESENLRKETNQIVLKLREEFDSLKNDQNKARNGDKKTSKSYVPDLGVQKVPDIDKGLIETANAARRQEQHPNDPGFLKRVNRETEGETEPDGDRKMQPEK